MTMDNELDNQDKSKFNAAIATLKRIDEAKRLMMDYKINNDYIGWYKCVGFIRANINGKMKSDERIKADTFEELIEECLKPKRDYSIATPYFTPKKQTLDVSKLRFLLLKYEYFLTDIEEKRGMGLIDEDDDDGL